MANSRIAGTFASGSNPGAGLTSDSCVIPTGRTTMFLTLTGLDASNSVKSQKRTTPGGTWTDQTTYTTDQNATSVTVAAGDEWRVFQIAQQPIRDVRFALNAG